MANYAIRHKLTGTYFSTYAGGQRRGSTYNTLPFKGPPRLFTTKTGALNCLRWWLSGPAKLEYDYDGDGNHYAIGASPGKGNDPTRVAIDMEIVEVMLSVIGS